MPGININELPREIRDKLDLKSMLDQTFFRALEEDYTDVLFEMLNSRSQVDRQHSFLADVEGCHREGALIFTKDGYKKIEDIKDNDLVWDGEQFSYCKLIRKGKRKCYKVTLSNNQELYMTRDHHMATNNGFMPLSAIELNKHSFITGNIPWSKDWNENSVKACLVGMLMADGHLDSLEATDKYKYNRISKYNNMSRSPVSITIRTRNRIRFYKSDFSLRDFFKKSLVQLGLLEKMPGEYRDYGTTSTKVVSIQNKKVFDYFVGLGVPVGNKTAIMHLPEWIKADDAAMNGFLAGYFACDGSYYKRGIEISTCSGQLARDIQLWLQCRGIICKIHIRKRYGNSNTIYRLFIKFDENIIKWCEHVPNISSIKKVELIERKDKISHTIKYTDDQCLDMHNLRIAGHTYSFIGRKYGVSCGSIKNVLDSYLSGSRGLSPRRKSTFPEYWAMIKSVEYNGIYNVYDLEVLSNNHQYIVDGFFSHNSQGSGKSRAAITMCSILDPNFSVDNIYFDIDELVYNKNNLKPGTAVLIDEQSESYGVDSHRVNIVLEALKEQLRKKSIHFIFCSPTLKPNYISSMYVFETMFIDYDSQECYMAMKTRDLHTLGYVRIPSPTSPKVGVSKEFMDAYEAKKDAHLDHLTGNKQHDEMEERAIKIMGTDLFKQAEKVYVSKMGYIPMSMLCQIINKLFPDFKSSIIVNEIASRIKLNKELAGKWEMPGGAGHKKRQNKKAL